jgi:cation diffusion facilitator family transporter
MAQATAGKLTVTPLRTALVSVAAAALLAALKLGIGLASGSLGLVSSGVESSGDVVAATLTLFAVRLAGRPADPEHPYGHRRAENLGALGEAALLLVGGLLVSIQAGRNLIEGAKPPEVLWYQLAVIGFALVVDLSRAIVSLAAARRYASPALRSNAQHFVADMVGSFTVLIGLLTVRAGFAQGDSIAALLVAAITLAVAMRLIVENADVLMDRTPVKAREAAERAIAALGADIELRRLRVRESAGRYFADVVVAVPPGRAVVEGHQTADSIEAALQGPLPGSDVVVHVEPRRRGVGLRERILALALAEPLIEETHDILIFEQTGPVSVSLHLKFPADLGLDAAHEVAQRVERKISVLPGVADVQTHLEPLERMLPAGGADPCADQAATREIERLVHERTGASPQRVKLLSTAAGRVLFLTLSGSPGESLSDAHKLAGELEEELRQRLTDIAEVVVRIKP